MPSPPQLPNPAESATLFRRALYTHLRAVVQGLFGDARVYALGALPSGGNPDRYVTWSKVDAFHERHQTGGAELVKLRYDVNVWARRTSDAERIADALRESLDNLRGSIGDAQDSAAVEAIFLMDENHDFTPPRDAGAAGWHRIRLDFQFVRRESATPFA